MLLENFNNTENRPLCSPVDSNDIRTEYTYNSVNGDVEWVTVKNENNQTLGSVNYTYDDDRRLTGIAANGQNYLFGYDAYGRTLTTKVGTSNSEPLSQNYYDNYNRLSQMNYGNDIVAHYAYDSVDNLKTLWYGNNSDLSFNYSYTKEGGIGLIRDTFNNLRTRYTYDLSGRLVGARRNVNANNDYGTTVAELDYKYEDKTNRIASSVTNVFGSKVDTQYVYGDASKGQIVNAIYGIKRFYGAYHMLYSYDALGRVTNRDIDYIGRDYTYTYCAGGYGANSTTTMVSSITSNGVTTGYQYYPTGSIQTITQNGTTVASYVYDDLNQLTSANQNGIQYTYTYGQNGNLLSKSNGTVTDTYVYGNSNWKDLLTSYNGQSIIYDTIGNPLTYRNGITMTWQRGRQLSTVTNGATTASYTYDESGTRYTKTVNGDVTTFAVIDGTLYGQLMPDGKKLVYLYDIDGTPYGFNYNGSNYFYDKNLQGDILAVINSSNSVLAKYTYDPWGKLLSVTDANGNDISANASHIGNINPLRYRGYYYDAETGFYYLNSRYYDPETCRFVNADNNFSNYNLFMYCANNPVNRIDPDGEHWYYLWIDDLFEAVDELMASVSNLVYGRAAYERSFYDPNGANDLWDSRPFQDIEPSQEMQIFTEFMYDHDFVADISVSASIPKTKINVKVGVSNLLSPNKNINALYVHIGGGQSTSSIFPISISYSVGIVRGVKAKEGYAGRSLNIGMGAGLGLDYAWYEASSFSFTVSNAYGIYGGFDYYWCID